MLNRNNPYYRQVELVVRLLPLVSRESCFALKGGTAINLFVRDLPRLSVDIDLVYLPLSSRAEALADITERLMDLSDRIVQLIPGARVNRIEDAAGQCQKLQVLAGGVRTKLEVSPVMRGSVLPPEEAVVAETVVSSIGHAEARILNRDELYAGKLVAALDRQHPRDLFDVKLLLEDEGVTAALIDLFVVYLASGPRPMAEILAPNMIPLQPVYDRQFRGMSLFPVSVDELDACRRQLIEDILHGLTSDQKAFLLSFKAGEPEWQRLVYPEAQTLPAVQWKLQNIRSLRGRRREAALDRLKVILSE